MGLDLFLCFTPGIIERQSKEKKMTAALIIGSTVCDVMIYLDVAES